jgi:hypothetical protein
MPSLRRFWARLGSRADAPRPLAPTWARLTILVLTALFVTIWALANVFIMAGGADRVVATSDSARVVVGGGWAPLPWSVRARRITFRMHDQNVELELVLSGARVDVDLVSLARKRFHATRVRADDVAFHFRHHVHEVRGNEGRLVAFPHIEGFPDPPLYRPAPPQSGSHKKQWTVALDGVDVPVTDLWMLEYRFRGDARATGGFELEPGQRLDVEPSNLELASGRVTVGDRVAVAALSGIVGCRVESFDVRAKRGLEVFRQISAAVDIHGGGADLGVARIYAPKLAGLGANGDLRVDAKVRRGVVGAGSVLHFVAKDAAFTAGKIVVHGTVTGDVRVPRESPSRPRLSAEARVLEIQAKDAPPVMPVPRVEGPRAWLDLASADLAASPTVDRIGLELPQAIVPNLGFVNLVLGKKLFLSGSARASAGLRGSPRGEVTGDVEIDARDALLDLGSNRLMLTVSASVEPFVHDVPLNRGEARALTVLAENVVLYRRDGNDWKQGRYWLDAKGTDVHWKNPPEGSVYAKLRVGAPDPEPLLSALIANELEKKVAPALLGIGTTRGVVRVEHVGRELGVELDPIQSGALLVRGGIRTVRGRTCGALLLKRGAVELGVKLGPGGTDVVPLANSNWLRARRGRPCESTD